jgi:hypothetical protein
VSSGELFLPPFLIIVYIWTDGFVSLCRSLVVVNTVLMRELHLATSSILIIILDILPVALVSLFFANVGRLIFFCPFALYYLIDS